VTYSVHQHWDPLKVCAVGQTYPPEFYHYISNPKVRSVMERIAEETQEDLQGLTNVLESFGIQTVRTDLSDDFSQYLTGKTYLPPPMTPRDDLAMIGEQFFMPTPNKNSKWNDIKGLSWPENPPNKWEQLSTELQQELKNNYQINTINQLYYRDYSSLTSIEQLVKSQNNKIIYDIKIDSAMVSRIGRDLYFGTWNKGQDTQPLKSQMESMFPEYRCHIVDTGGHLDGTFCPVVPGLIVSSKEISREEFNKLFPGWEVVYTTKSIDNVNFLKLKEKNAGKWWVPGEEDNDDLIQFVQTYIDHWVGLIEETIIDVNMLVIDEKNVLCIKEDPEVFSAFERYGVTPHLTPFRHYNFWDGGLHCITADLHRDGDIKDFFPGRA
jgi:hypothetical protein